MKIIGTALSHVVVAAAMLCACVPGPQPTTDKTSRVTLTGPQLSTQEQDEWCWAATISNVFAYHGHPLSQARIVTTLYGAPGDWRGGAYSNMAALLNRNWVDDLGNLFTSRVVGLYDAMAGVSTLSNDSIRAYLDKNEPLTIGTTQHAMLLVSMTYAEMNGSVQRVDEVDVFDPWPGKGFRPLTAPEATEMTNGGALMFIAAVEVSP